MQEELLRILETEKKTMIFVTHSIDEAILLGDRIVMMSRRPGRIQGVILVNIPRPRKIITVRAHPRYIELRICSGRCSRRTSIPPTRQERPMNRKIIVRLVSLIFVLLIWGILRQESKPDSVYLSFGDCTCVLRPGRQWRAAELYERKPVGADLCVDSFGVGRGSAWRGHGTFLDCGVGRGYLCQCTVLTPMVAVVPLIVLWFGFKVPAKVIIVFLFMVFPVLLNTYEGVKNVDRNLQEVARSFCSSESQLWRHLIIPSAIPFIVAGVRLAIGRGLVGMIVAEFYTSSPDWVI